MQGAANDFVHALELLGCAELNFSEHYPHGNDNLNKHLMIEVFDKTVGIIFAFLPLQCFDPVGVEHRQNDRNQKKNDQPGEGKIFNQAKRFDFFFRLFRIHRQSSRYLLGR